MFTCRPCLSRLPAAQCVHRAAQWDGWGFWKVNVSWAFGNAGSSRMVNALASPPGQTSSRHGPLFHFKDLGHSSPPWWPTAHLWDRYLFIYFCGERFDIIVGALAVASTTKKGIFVRKTPRSGIQRNSEERCQGNFSCFFFFNSNLTKGGNVRLRAKYFHGQKGPKRMDINSFWWGNVSLINIFHFSFFFVLPFVVSLQTVLNRF